MPQYPSKFSTALLRFLKTLKYPSSSFHLLLPLCVWMSTINYGSHFFKFRTIHILKNTYERMSLSIIGCV